MNLEWSFDGPLMSVLVDLDQPTAGPIGTVSKNSNETWTPYDCTRRNQHGTTAFSLRTVYSREEAKQLVEQCFRNQSTQDPKGQLKADFTSNPWAAAVDKRWSEVCELLDKHLTGMTEPPFPNPRLLIAELKCLNLVLQYAGNNIRSSWVVAIINYENLMIT